MFIILPMFSFKCFVVIQIFDAAEHILDLVFISFCCNTDRMVDNLLYGRDKCSLIFCTGRVVWVVNYSSGL